MRQRLKITLSLLISLVLCGGFAVFSFTPLFNIVETTFFQPRIEEARQDQLLQIADRVARYHRDNFDRLQPTLGQPFVPAAFEESGQQAREDIFERQNWFGTLLDGNPNIQLVRILGSEGKKIHFSTLNEDIESRDRERIKYLDYERTGETIESADLLTPAGADARVIIDGEGQRFIYSFPVVEEGNYRGVVLFYVASRDLLEYLLRFPALDVRELSLLGRQGIVFNIPLRDLSEVESDLLEIWRQAEVQGQVYQEPVVFEKAVEPGGQDGPAESGRESYSVLSLNTGELGVLSLLIPYSVFQLQPIMKIVVVTAIFLTVFLGIYLVLNLRQDPVLVLTQRVKRLQLDILKEFIEGKEGVDWQQWRSRLENNRGDLKSRIKRGIGRIPSQREQELDRMIDRSWDEIISIIEARVGAQRPEAPDIRHIEQLLQRALEGAQLTVQAPVQAPPQPAARRAGLVVEEIGVEEVVEPGEVIPSAGEELEEVEEAETVEEAEELEEAEGAEEAEELEEAEEVEEAETVEEAEELEEAEEVEEAEELEEAEAVEEAEELEEAEAVEEAETVEEAEELEEAEEVEEAEELEEAEAVEEAMEPLLFEGAEQEGVEELESVREIVPLPLLPQEQLEELPYAEEEPEEISPAAAQLPAEPVQAPAAAAPVETAAGAEAVEELEVAEDEAAPIESILGAGEDLVMEALPGQDKAVSLSPEEIEKIQRLDEKKQLQELIEAKIIQTFTLEAIEAIIMEQRSSVVIENGVYRIKEEVVSGPEGRARGLGLMALAEASLSETGQSSALAESGIGALLGDESILDLETELGQIRDRGSEIDYASLKRSKKIHFFEDGLDYDEYLKAYREGRTETDRLRSLVELSGKLKAVNAAVFSRDDGRYSLVLKVGLADPGFEIAFQSDEPFIELLVKPRHTVFIKENTEKIKALAKKLHPDDLKYMQASILFPAVFQGRESFLFLGLPVQWDLRIEDIITRLDIY